ncbi:MAG: acyl-CoA dehydrogenase family protein, partial [Myxococcales bacterium]
MNLELTDVQKAVRDTARTFARERIAPIAKALNEEERFPTELLREAASLGLLGVNVPEEYGGSAAGVVSYALSIMEIAEADCGTTVAVAVTNMVAELINAFGTDTQKQKYLPRITSGEALCGAFALSETQSASDAAGMKTFAERRGDSYVLNGAKQWISHGAYAGVFVVWARTDRDAKGSRGISAFIVEGGTRGLTAGRPEEKMGIRSSNTVPLVFEDCVIPAGNLLGKEGDGFKLAMIALDGGRIGIGSQACGVSRAALAASVRYAKERTAFGHPTGDFQALRFFMADMATQLKAAELMVLRAAFLKEQKRPFTR